MKPELPFSRGLLIFAGLFFIVFVVMAANGADGSDHTPVVFEAESGTAGSGISIGQEGNIGYITAKTNFTGQSSPGDSTRLITCEIIFRDTGYYQLFVRMRVGAGAYDDDSFFAARGFGKKGLSEGSDWVFINGLASAGFSSSSDLVEEMGVAGSQVWKWVNISLNFFPAASAKTTFYVGAGNLIQTFQIATREDGLAIDKLAFGKADLFYTVETLDKGLPGLTTRPETPEPYPGPPLAQGSAKFLGNVMASDKIFANYWNQITPGNEGKWGSVAGTSDSARWNWAGLDNIYNYAKQHQLIFKNHTLIWGSQQPSWISSLDSATQLKYIETWIRMVGKRYPEMDMIDVVNEPLVNHNPPDGGNNRANYKKALGGNGTTGWDWVIKSFELARKYIPQAKLLLNDYGIINDNSATTTYLTIINLLKARGLIDGIGVQGHRFELENASTTTLKNNLDRLAASGLPVYISEMDLGNLRDEGTPDDNQQLQLYQKIFPVLWDHPAVKGITLWGYREGEMWQPTCYLVLKNGAWRPAMTWLADYVYRTTGIDAGIPGNPPAVSLEQNYPNPVSTATEIRFTLSQPQKVTLTIFDNLGREVITLIDETLNSGHYSIPWIVRNHSDRKIESGIYYYRLTAGSTLLSRKMLILK
ncbi:MAG TPA: endo-1,4-beta-xylanase [Prolixibacteraceae bacterium]|jgi:endo-1,4-beta-xylanase|nr:T9SS type A sorting domain-containing protein [Bacteroidales bacterium]HNZ68996.1 endo-1,4-beta-xylanase [Prolixibacteraceae bacterium]HOC86708.1 endo-1,4-beta-xylanase [Prolixibacteraceae bacterium]HOG94627.1 endo-1,4-beta-xylanase [Prolixibacteraceae bacterium]HOY93201.1 endo-1,4-beta-xylanase [Prolixibacteraceae bacterium]